VNKVRTGASKVRSSIGALFSGRSGGGKKDKDQKNAPMLAEAFKD
jgi:hypothetical protein